MMRLIWIRHGETKGNQMKRYIGHLDEPLAETGKEQAVRLAEALSREKIDFVVTSDLKRAVQTARPFLQKHPGIPVAVMPALRECSFGIWEGKTYQEAEKLANDAWWDWIRDPVRFAPPKGESLMDLHQRMQRFLRELEQNRSGDTVAVFTHGGPIRWFFAYHVYQCRDDFWKPSIGHGEGWVAEKKEAGWIISRSLFQKGDF
jgi:alpha-ribazole phosphatase